MLLADEADCVPDAEHQAVTCAKQTVSCTLVSKSGAVVIGTNRCADAQPVCPRRPGEGYEKCQTVCQQMGHAEIQALARADLYSVDLTDAIAIIQGHYYACEPCARALKEAGISQIIIRVKK